MLIDVSDTTLNAPDKIHFVLFILYIFPFYLFYIYFHFVFIVNQKQHKFLNSYGKSKFYYKI